MNETSSFSKKDGISSGSVTRTKKDDLFVERGAHGGFGLQLGGTPGQTDGGS